jgi:hypothetical protein
MLLFLSLLFLASCGKNSNETPTDGPILPRGDGNQHTPDLPQGDTQGSPGVGDNRMPFTPVVRDGVSGIDIVWGFSPVMFEYDFMFNISVATNQGNEGGGIQALLGKLFDVRLVGAHVPDINHFYAMEPRPDIFFTNPHIAHGTGVSRTIPEEMLRRYAPNYAALLDRHDGWEVSRAPNGEQFALNTFDAYHNDLDMFSVYRLDWLERQALFYRRSLYNG